MERDFLDLSLQNRSPTVKEEAADDSKNSARERGSRMQWSFSNKVFTLPQLLSFKGAPQENRQRKIVHDPLGSSTLMTIPTVDPYLDTNQKPFSSPIQKNFVQEKQAGHHYSMTVYHPTSNQSSQTIPFALSTPVFQSHIASNVTNVVPSTMEPRSLRGLPIISSVPAIPSNSSIVGTTDLRNTTKSSGASSQLTIFYGGSVSVYDDISPEKAQAIMVLAGNGSSPTSNNPLSMVPAPVETSARKPSTGNGFIRSLSFSGPPSPISLAMRSDTQCGGGSNNSNGLAVVKTVGASASYNHSEPPKVVTSAGPVTTPVIPAAVPQARKASLARFLEKRKERVISTSPYNVSKKSSDCAAPGSECTSLSVNSSSSCALSATN